MSRYFFDLHDEQLTHHDTDGTICADDREVSAMATRVLAEIAAHEPLRAGQKKLFVTVRDEAARVVYTSALNITGSWLRSPIAALPVRLELKTA
ncbi:DUF6894 family protein [Methylobacterium durans]|nr:hypothetical protein [Methylobacterium durans]